MFKVVVLSVAFLAVAICSATAKDNKPEARIIGGQETDIAAHPYLVSVRYRKNSKDPYLHRCAGVIYNPRFIITAAQCVAEIADNNRVVVVVGPSTRTGVDGYVYPVSKAISHPDYSTWTMEYDIGLLMLEVPLDLSLPQVEAIAIRNQRPAAGKVGTIAGWGYREEFGPSAYQLEEAKVPIWSNAECTNSYGVGEITERMICAGYSSGGVDACQGDTGGPLIVDNELVGVVSWGRGCARPGYPTVYTLVSSLKKWIDDTIAATEN